MLLEQKKPTPDCKGQPQAGCEPGAQLRVSNGAGRDPRNPGKRVSRQNAVQKKIYKIQKIPLFIILKVVLSPVVHVLRRNYVLLKIRKNLGANAFKAVVKVHSYKV